MTIARKMLLGMIFGVIFGLLFGEKAILLKPIGSIFTNLIQMIAIPLIFFSLLSGITGIRDPNTLKKIGTKALLGFLLTGICSVTIAIVVYYFVQPGLGLKLLVPAEAIVPIVKAKIGLAEIINNIVPSNLVQSFANGSIIQTVFLSVFTAFAIKALGDSNGKILEAIEEINKLVFKMVHMITLIAPYGAFCLIAALIGKQGIEILKILSPFIVTVVISYFFQYLNIGLLITIFAKVSPLPFYRKSMEYQILALSTGSTKASLATTMDISRKKLGLSYHNSSFVFPIGASINMDGASVYLATACLFLSQALGLEFGLYQYTILIVMSTIGTIGTAGLIGGAVITLPILMSQLNIPLEYMALLIGIDSIMNALRTFANITSDAGIALIVDSSENELNKKVYYS